MRRLKLSVFLIFFLCSVVFFGLRFITPTVAGQGGGVTLPAPAGVTASDGNYADKIGIQWTAVRGANNYRIFRGTTNNPAAATDVGTSATPSAERGPESARGRGVQPTAQSRGQERRRRRSGLLTPAHATPRSSRQWTGPGPGRALRANGRDHRRGDAGWLALAR